MMGCTIFREKMMRNGAGHHHARLCNDPTDDNASENWPRPSSLSLALFPFFFSLEFIPPTKVILLRGEAIETGRRTKFRELRRLCRWNKNVNRWPKATETFYQFHLLPISVASPVNNSTYHLQRIYMNLYTKT